MTLIVSWDRLPEEEQQEQIVPTKWDVMAPSWKARLDRVSSTSFGVRFRFPRPDVVSRQPVFVHLRPHRRAVGTKAPTRFRPSC
jgi:hypothetical protein